MLALRLPTTASRSARRTVLAGLAATVATTGLVLAGTTAPAHAATARNGGCASGEFCLYYYSGQGGSVSDFTASVSNYGSTQPGCYDFKGVGTGKGQCVKNNAESVRNRTGRSVTVYYNSGYAGASQTFASGQAANLNATLSNNNASHKLR